MDTSERIIAKLVILLTSLVCVLIILIVMFAKDTSDFNSALFGGILFVGICSLALLVTIVTSIYSKSLVSRIDQSHDQSRNTVEESITITMQPVPSSQPATHTEYIITIHPEDKITMARTSNDKEVVIVHNP